MKIKLCIIGPGVVGQATGKVFVKLGYDTTFLGGNPEKTKKLLHQGFKAFGRNDLFDGNYDFDISMLTVPTPTVNGKINFSAITSASIDLGKRLKLRRQKKYHLVVVKSTVPPGTSENIVAGLVAKNSGLKLGKDFGLCMNPEYLREKTAYSDALRPWVILIGEHDRKSGKMLEKIYKKFKCLVFHCTTEEAEFQKYVHNLFNSAKITFFNEMREIGKKSGLNANKIFAITALSAEGMWNPKYGIRDFGPFSGNCLPKDTQAFLRWAEQNGAKADVLKSIIRVNANLPSGNGSANKEIKDLIIGGEL